MPRRIIIISIIIIRNKCNLKSTIEINHSTCSRMYSNCFEAKYESHLKIEETSFMDAMQCKREQSPLNIY